MLKKVSKVNRKLTLRIPIMDPTGTASFMVNVSDDEPSAKKQRSDCADA